MTLLSPPPDPQLDLFFERIIDVSPELVWVAWTTPAHLKQWFTPAPWRTIGCEIDLRPGGLFRTVMCSPEGQEFPNLEQRAHPCRKLRFRSVRKLKADHLIRQVLGSSRK